MCNDCGPSKADLEHKGNNIMSEQTNILKCSYCGQEIDQTKPFSFSYGLPGVPRIFACNNESCISMRKTETVCASLTKEQLLERLEKLAADDSDPEYNGGVLKTLLLDYINDKRVTEVVSRIKTYYY